MKSSRGGFDDELQKAVRASLDVQSVSGAEDADRSSEISISLSSLDENCFMGISPSRTEAKPVVDDHYCDDFDVTGVTRPATVRRAPAMHKPIMATPPSDFPQAAAAAGAAAGSDQKSPKRAEIKTKTPTASIPNDAFFGKDQDFADMGVLLQSEQENPAFHNGLQGKLCEDWTRAAKDAKLVVDFCIVSNHIQDDEKETRSSSSQSTPVEWCQPKGASSFARSFFIRLKPQKEIMEKQLWVLTGFTLVKLPAAMAASKVNWDNQGVWKHSEPVLERIDGSRDNNKRFRFVCQRTSDSIYARFEPLSPTTLPRAIVSMQWVDPTTIQSPDQPDSVAKCIGHGFVREPFLWPSFGGIDASTFGFGARPCAAPFLYCRTYAQHCRVWVPRFCVNDLCDVLEEWKTAKSQKQRSDWRIARVVEVRLSNHRPALYTIQFFGWDRQDLSSFQKNKDETELLPFCSKVQVWSGAVSSEWPWPHQETTFKALQARLNTLFASSGMVTDEMIAHGVRLYWSLQWPSMAQGLTSPIVCERSDALVSWLVTQFFPRIADTILSEELPSAALWHFLMLFLLPRAPTAQIRQKATPAIRMVCAKVYPAIMTFLEKTTIKPTRTTSASFGTGPTGSPFATSSTEPNPTRHRAAGTAECSSPSSFRLLEAIHVAVLFHRFWATEARESYVSLSPEAIQAISSADDLCLQRFFLPPLASQTPSEVLISGLELSARYSGLFFSWNSEQHLRFYRSVSVATGKVLSSIAGEIASEATRTALVLSLRPSPEDTNKAKQQLTQLLSLLLRSEWASHWWRSKQLETQMGVRKAIFEAMADMTVDPDFQWGAIAKGKYGVPFGECMLRMGEFRRLLWSFRTEATQPHSEVIKEAASLWNTTLACLTVNRKSAEAEAPFRQVPLDMGELEKFTLFWIELVHQAQSSSEVRMFAIDALVSMHASGLLRSRHYRGVLKSMKQWATLDWFFAKEAMNALLNLTVLPEADRLQVQRDVLVDPRADGPAWDEGSKQAIAEIALFLYTMLRQTTPSARVTMETIKTSVGRCISSLVRLASVGDCHTAGETVAKIWKDLLVRKGENKSRDLSVFQEVYRVLVNAFVSQGEQTTGALLPVMSSLTEQETLSLIVSLATTKTNNDENEQKAQFSQLVQGLARLALMQQQQNPKHPPPPTTDEKHTRFQIVMRTCWPTLATCTLQGLWFEELEAALFAKETSKAQREEFLWDVFWHEDSVAEVFDTDAWKWWRACFFRHLGEEVGGEKVGKRDLLVREEQQSQEEPRWSTLIPQTERRFLLVHRKMPSPLQLLQRQWTPFWDRLVRLVERLRPVQLKQFLMFWCSLWTRIAVRTDDFPLVVQLLTLFWEKIESETINAKSTRAKLSGILLSQVFYEQLTQLGLEHRHFATDLERGMARVSGSPLFPSSIVVDTATWLAVSILFQKKMAESRAFWPLESGEIITETKANKANKAETETKRGFFLANHANIQEATVSLLSSLCIGETALMHWRLYFQNGDVESWKKLTAFYGVADAVPVETDRADASGSDISSTSRLQRWGLLMGHGWEQMRAMESTDFLRLCNSGSEGPNPPKIWDLVRSSAQLLKQTHRVTSHQDIAALVSICRILTAVSPRALRELNDDIQANLLRLFRALLTNPNFRIRASQALRESERSVILREDLSAVLGQNETVLIAETRSVPCVSLLGLASISANKQERKLQQKCLTDHLMPSQLASVVLSLLETQTDPQTDLTKEMGVLLRDGLQNAVEPIQRAIVAHLDAHSGRYESKLETPDGRWDLASYRGAPGLFFALKKYVLETVKRPIECETVCGFLLNTLQSLGPCMDRPVMVTDWHSELLCSTLIDAKDVRHSQHTKPQQDIHHTALWSLVLTLLKLPIQCRDGADKKQKSKIFETAVSRLLDDLFPAVTLAGSAPPIERTDMVPESIRSWCQSLSGLSGEPRWTNVVGTKARGLRIAVLHTLWSHIPESTRTPCRIAIASRIRDVLLWSGAMGKADMSAVSQLRHMELVTNPYCERTVCPNVQLLQRLSDADEEYLPRDDPKANSIKTSLTTDPRFASETNQTKSKKTKFCGLYNLGSTCYINATLQQLFSNRGFRKLILDWPLLPSGGNGTAESSKTPSAEKETDAEDDAVMLLRAWKSLFLQMATGEKEIVDPTAFIRCCRMGGERIDTRVQQDAEEFGRAILDTLHGLACRPVGGFPKEKALLEDMFEFQQAYEKRGQGSCSHRSETSDRNFGLFSVAMATSLEEAFDKVIAPETVQLNCALCNTKNVPTLRTPRFVKLPSTLMLSLKRFRMDFQRNTTSKSNGHCSFPMRLRINESKTADSSSSKTLTYQLTGITVHHGSMQAGHYYALCYDPDGDTWSELNDTRITTAPRKEFEQEYVASLFGEKEATNRPKPNAVLFQYQRVEDQNKPSTDQTTTANLEAKETKNDAKNSDPTGLSITERHVVPWILRTWPTEISKMGALICPFIEEHTEVVDFTADEAIRLFPSVVTCLAHSNLLESRSGTVFLLLHQLIDAFSTKPESAEPLVVDALALLLTNKVYARALMHAEAQAKSMEANARVDPTAGPPPPPPVKKLLTDELSAATTTMTPGELSTAENLLRIVERLFELLFQHGRLGEKKPHQPSSMIIGKLSLVADRWFAMTWTNCHALLLSPTYRRIHLKISHLLLDATGDVLLKLATFQKELRSAFFWECFEIKTDPCVRIPLAEYHQKLEIACAKQPERKDILSVRLHRPVSNASEAASVKFLISLLVRILAESPDIYPPVKPHTLTAMYDIIFCETVGDAMIQRSIVARYANSSVDPRAHEDWLQLETTSKWLALAAFRYGVSNSTTARTTLHCQTIEQHEKTFGSFCTVINRLCETIDLLPRIEQTVFPWTIPLVGILCRPWLDLSRNADSLSIFPLALIWAHDRNQRIRGNWFTVPRQVLFNFLHQFLIDRSMVWTLARIEQTEARLFHGVRKPLEDFFEGATRTMSFVCREFETTGRGDKDPPRSAWEATDWIEPIHRGCRKSTRLVWQEMKDFAASSEKLSRFFDFSTDRSDQCGGLLLGRLNGLEEAFLPLSSKADRETQFEIVNRVVRALEKLHVSCSRDRETKKIRPPAEAVPPPPLEKEMKMALFMTNPESKSSAQTHSGFEKMKEAEAKMKEAEAKMQEAEAQMKEAEAKAKEAEAKMNQELLSQE